MLEFIEESDALNLYDEMLDKRYPAVDICGIELRA